jgi:hypothetical protein
VFLSIWGNGGLLRHQVPGTSILFWASSAHEEFTLVVNSESRWFFKA